MLKQLKEIMKNIHVYALFLLFVFCSSCGGENKPGLPKKNIKAETKEIVNSPGPNERDIHTMYEYTDSIGKRLIIQNGYPRGGIKYTDPHGNEYAYAVFWTRIINETDNQLELKFDFPINSYEISNLPGKYVKVLLPADTMTLDKISLFNYGQTDVESFLDNNIHKPSSLKRTINPKESSGFYFLMLILTEGATGMTRTGLSLKGQDLFYKISRYSSTKPITLLDEKEIHCGSINLKNLMLRK
jgi:hypothetical protein